MDELGGHYANWNKTDRDKQYCMVSLICVILKKKASFIETENRMVAARSWEEGEKGRCSQSVQTSNYKNKFWGSNV